MKYVLFLGDGMADLPMKELDGLTPLEYAKTPAIDRIALYGEVGMLKTVAKGFEPGSDVANLTILGYDTRQFYTGRAPLEAAGIGIQLGSNDVAYRCNFTKMDGKRMLDYSACHINDTAAKIVAERLKNELNIPGVEFYHGTSYRNIIIWHNGKLAHCTPPHDISNKRYSPFLPQGEGADLLKEIMNKARQIIKEMGNSDITDIWIWGGGTKPQLENFKKRNGVGGSVVSAVDLVRGIGKLAGLYAPKIEGATGVINTNYENKVKSALSLLQKNDFLFLHYEAADEAGHSGNVNEKVQAIENFDHLIVEPVMNELPSFGKWRVAVLPDHATPIKQRTHSKQTVPFAILDSDMPKNSGCNFNEREIEEKNSITIDIGWKGMRKFLR
ncbi:MAG: putative 2,3-bisphosphoglycerate-independent phosphoglycerate mutase [bacterium]|nr:MAG: putative 2,3-bisphosphoglycerate-independent phosphoglycerate mutase [bacterium]